MGPRVTAALAGAVVIALAVLWLDLQRSRLHAPDWGLLGEPRGEAPGGSVKRLLDFDPATITAIRLVRDGRQVEIARTAAGWVGPIEPRLVDDFLGNLREMAEIAPLDVQRAELADYGLDPPQGEIELTRAGGTPIIVLLGAHNPASTSAYAQLGKDGPVVLTGALMLWEFNKAFRAAAAGALPVEIVQHAGQWESGYGERFYNIVGRLKNSGSHPLRWVRLRADLVDAGGRTVASRELYNAAAEGLGRDDLPEPFEEKLAAVNPTPIAPGGEDRFRTSFLAEETPPFTDYHVNVVAVGPASAP